MTARRFSTLLLTIVALAAIGTLASSLGVLSRVREVSPFSTTRVGDLEITGTTDATGQVLARAGLRLTTASTGATFTAGSGAPAGSAPRGSLYLRTDSANIYQNTDGSTTWVQAGGVTDGDKGDITVSSSGATWTIDNSAVTLAKMENRTQATFIGRKNGAGTGAPQEMTAAEALTVLGIPTPASASVSVTDDGATGGTLNLSTLGTLDWIAIPGCCARPGGLGPSGVHRKIKGGWITTSLAYLNAGAPYSDTGSTTVSTTATDDMIGTALSSASEFGVQATSSATAASSNGLGFSFIVPAGASSRVLRVYMGGSGCDSGATTITVAAVLRDAGTSSSTSIAASHTAKVVYTAPVADDLVVTVRLTNVGGGVGFCTFVTYGVSLGPS